MLPLIHNFLLKESEILKIVIYKKITHQFGVLSKSEKHNSIIIVKKITSDTRDHHPDCIKM